MLFGVAIIVSWLLAVYVEQNNPVQFASTTASEYSVDGESILLNPATLILDPWVSRDFVAYVDFTSVGSPPFTLYNFSYYDGMSWTYLTATITAGRYEWTFIGDWSNWEEVRLEALYDTGFSIQRPLLAGSEIATQPNFNGGW